MSATLPLTPVFRWFRAKYGQPTPAQREAWPRIRRGRNVLVASPTGTGKTFAAFLSVIDELARQHSRGGLPQGIQCIYISPLRALAYDLEKNLAEPLGEIFGPKPPIRVALRSGDTPGSQRARHFISPPHILLTTPESLCVLLSQPKWLPLLASVRWVIIDEIHALAENKRGAHLSVSIERLAAMRCGALQRIGLSATVAPLDVMGRFLSGTAGECDCVDASAAKRIELRVHTPLRRDPYPEAGFTGQRLIRELAQAVDANRTTLVFTNTRSGAEAATFWLREARPELANAVECHHASLDRDVRQKVEDRLKRGELRAVVCSTSLELGIDIGSVDLVVMLSTPKGVSKALQRTGRSGHNIHSLSRGVLMATNVNDLVEACATVLLARARKLDDVRLPSAPLDVLAQHLVSMGCEREWSRDEAFALVRQAFPYRGLDRRDFDDVLEYLAGGGQALRLRYSDVFGKIELDETHFKTYAGRVQREFLQNVGTIPSVGTVHVRLKNRRLGFVEEMFARQLQPGDVFVISGRAVRVERAGLMEVFVTSAEKAVPTIPRWNANKMPLSNNVAEEIIRFRGEIRARMEESEEIVPWIAKRLDCGRMNAGIIARMYEAQRRISEIPTSDFLLVEQLAGRPEEAGSRRGTARSVHYFFHSVIGRAANDALSRVLTRRLSMRRGGNAVATPHDYGFVLTIAADQAFRSDELPELLSREGFLADLRAALEHSEMLKYHFRNAAQTGLMVYRNFFDQQKSVRKLQWSSEVIFKVLQQHEPEHVLLREARRDSMHLFLDAKAAEAYCARMGEMPVRIHRIARVPPLSFAMYATRIKEALLVEDPAATMERLFNLWWREIEEGAPA
jgi:ATP-dependent Lhr-like helicase